MYSLAISIASVLVRGKVLIFITHWLNRVA
nr:MAG TPA: hypothetical protein [Bacteriophage sp.]